MDGKWTLDLNSSLSFAHVFYIIRAYGSKHIHAYAIDFKFEIWSHRRGENLIKCMHIDITLRNLSRQEQTSFQMVLKAMN